MKLFYKIIIAAAIAGFGFLSFQLYTRTQELKEQKKENIKMAESLKEEHRNRIRKIDSLKDLEINKLKSRVDNLSKYSNSLINKIRRYEEAPDFDLDFLSAADVITNSNYRPNQ